MFEGGDKPIDTLLSDTEISELRKIQSEPGVVGYLLFNDAGAHLASENVSHDDLGPIFANAFDMADAIADDLGENRGAPALFMESAAYEIAALRLSACNALIIRKKPEQRKGGFGAQH